MDVSIQSTELASPDTLINIQDITVSGLTEPISITVPLLTALNTTNPNRTLGCGYLDETDQIFKADGISIQTINTLSVKCLAAHLTAIGVQEYTADIQISS